MPIITTLGKESLENLKFNVSLDYIDILEAAYQTECLGLEILLKILTQFSSVTLYRY